MCLIKRRTGRHCPSCVATIKLTRHKLTKAESSRGGAVVWVKGGDYRTSKVGLGAHVKVPS
jgi:hypothetical protein